MTPTVKNRRRNHIDMPVSYAAVGASQAPDLLRFPPEGTTPFEEEVRLGSGQERFISASAKLMTWGAHRGSGATVTELERGDEEPYEGPSFDASGQPRAAAAREDRFGPDGEPYLVPGTTVRLDEPGQGERTLLVIYAVDSERRAGFAWGTCDEAGAIGEQFFAVEQREDDTVWAVTRGFLSAPKGGLLGMRGRSDLKSALDAAKRAITALAPGGAGG